MIEFCFYLFASLLIAASLAVIFSRNPVHSVLWLIFAFFNAAGLFILLGAEFIAMLLIIVYVGAVVVLFLFVVMMMNVTPREQSRIFSMDRIQSSAKAIVKLLLYGTVFAVTVNILIGVPVLYDVSQNVQSLSGAALWRGFTTSVWSVASPTPHMLAYGIFFLSMLLARFAAQTIVRHKFTSLFAEVVDSIVVMMAVGITLMAGMVYLGVHFLSSPVSDDLVAVPMPPTDLTTNTHALGQIIYKDYIFAFEVGGLILLVAMLGAIVLTFRRREGLKRQNTYTQISRRPEDTLVMHQVPLGQGIE